MYSRPNLDEFFKAHPAHNRLELALDVIARKAKEAKLSLQSDDEDEFLYHLSEVHEMVEKILSEIGTHKDAIKQQYPDGIKSFKRYQDDGGHRFPSHDNPRQEFPRKPNYPSGYRGY